MLSQRLIEKRLSVSKIPSRWGIGFSWERKANNKDLFQKWGCNKHPGLFRPRPAVKRFLSFPTPAVVSAFQICSLPPNKPNFNIFPRLTTCKTNCALHCSFFHSCWSVVSIHMHLECTGNRKYPCSPATYVLFDCGTSNKQVNKIRLKYTLLEDVINTVGKMG